MDRKKRTRENVLTGIKTKEVTRKFIACEVKEKNVVNIVTFYELVREYSGKCNIFFLVQSSSGLM